MSADPVEGGPEMASDESQRLFADELKALIAGAREEASVTQNDGQDTIQVNGQPSSEDQPEIMIQPQIEQEPEEEPTYVTRKSNDQHQEAQAAEPTMEQEPASPSRKRPSPGDEPESSPKPVKKKAKQCGVCQAQPGKYRCPRCPLVYCSVACNKSHKENHPPPSEVQPTPSTNIQQQQQQQQQLQQQQQPINTDPLAFLLPHAHHITRLLAKYPHLESRLNHILTQTLPPSNNPNGLHVDPNTGFATTASGLPVRVNVPGYASSSGNSYFKKDLQPWSKEVGLRRGAAALRKARTDPSETGDGVRELCETVLWLLKGQERGELARPGSNSNGAGTSRRDVTQLVREEVVKEEQEVVKRLLEEEIKGESGDR